MSNRPGRAAPTALPATDSSASAAGRSPETIVFPAPCLVVLVGAAGSGKSTWAAANFQPNQIVSPDALRAMVGDGEHDMAATDNAMSLVRSIVAHRLRRRLTAVVDATNLDPAERAAWRAEATAAGVPCFAVVIDTPAAETRRRNRDRALRVPTAVVDGQLRRAASVGAAIVDEDFAGVHVVRAERSSTAVLAPASLAIPSTTAATADAPRPALRFGLQVPRFAWPGGAAELGERLALIAQAAEIAGFDQLWVMDHVRQIPLMGRPWDDIPESYTTLAYLAGRTTTIKLGTLVTGLAYRNLAHLAKIIATLDVLSGGRALCGLGIGWYRQEYEAYGWPFPPLNERYDRLRDALELLPLMWGPGTPRFEGRTTTVAEAVCYPRPLQARIPMLVGGSGERTTLRIVARSADACNLFGEPDVVGRKVEVLHGYCREFDRDPAAIEVTQLSTVLAGSDHADVARLVESHRPGRVSAERFAAQVNAGTTDQHIGRFERLREAGVDRVMVSLHDLQSAEQIERFAPVIAAF